jgi:hypothetical protein
MNVPEGQTSQLFSTATERFRHGFTQLVLPFRTLRRDALAWRRYVRVCTFQAVVTLAIGAAFVASARGSSEGLREQRVEKALHQVKVHRDKAAGPTPPSPPSPALEAKHPRKATAAPPTPPKAAQDEEDAEDAKQRAEDEAELHGDVAELQSAVLALSKQAGPTAVRKDNDFQEAREELDKKLADLEDTAKKLGLSEEDKTALLQVAAELDVLEQKTKPGWWDSAWALALSIYGALSIAQSIVIAFSRDYHAAIARDASLLLGVAPEDPPLLPRVRLNVAWVRRKLKQRTRSLLVFLPGAALITVVAAVLPERALVTSVLTSLWASYWWVVWTASKSARAWERTGVAGTPWFLRLWHRYVASLPLVGWAARGVDRLWTRLTRPVYSPAEAVEAQPAEFAGLAAARALQLIPVLKLFVRPLVPVAAARLLAERAVRPELSSGTPWQLAATLEQQAAVPASPQALEARDEM